MIKRTKKTGIKGQYRQGDVLIQEIPALPDGAELVQPERKDLIVLAHGEATGHMHAIDSTLATQYEWRGNMLVEVKPGGAPVTHQEHDSIPLKAKPHRIVRQKEYQPNSIQNVAD